MLESADLPSKVERSMVIQVEAFDWNCSAPVSLSTVIF
jgi:hypothetical protein